ncbi:MAG: hypothetical protein ACRELB_13880, partial [Polyangiaceae bacterium]
MAEKTSSTHDHDAAWARALAGRLQVIAVVLENGVDAKAERELRASVRELRARIERNPEYRLMALVDLLDAVQELANLVGDERDVERYATELDAALAAAYPTNAARVKPGVIRRALAAARNLRGGRRGKQSPAGDRFWEIVEFHLAPAFLAKGEIVDLRKRVSARRGARARAPELLRGPM